MKFITSILCLSSFISMSAFAQVPSVPTTAPTNPVLFTYPELQVSPRASDRISMEAKTEAKSRRTQLLPLQISALSTALAGALAPKPQDPEKRERDDVKHSRAVAIGVGASWLVFSFLFNEEYTPFIKAQNVLKTLPEKTPQEDLVRERIAEEHLEAASSLGKKIMWASVLTNLAASAYLANNTENDGAVYAAAAGVLSFAPMVFRDRWQIVNEYHQDYKKRIYAPIALPTLMVAPKLADSRNSALVPGVTWSLSF